MHRSRHGQPEKSVEEDPAVTNANTRPQAAYNDRQIPAWVAAVVAALP
jgi:hypothetical protein